MNIFKDFLQHLDWDESQPSSNVPPGLQTSRLWAWQGKKGWWQQKVAKKTMTLIALILM